MTDVAIVLDESRYDRQERITWWDQEALTSARVLVVGAGALGNEVVKNLVLIGVGSIVVVDFDVVELSNLARCVFFRPGDDGTAKAPLLASRAAELNPEVEVVGLERDLRTFGTGIGLRADVMVGALDSREARLVLNRLAWRVQRPWVDGAIEALTGVARVFTPPTSCYECTLSETDWEILSHRQSCRLLGKDDLLQGKVPTTATTSSIVAGIEAQEVVKLLHRQRHSDHGTDPLVGAVVIDGSRNDYYPLHYPFDEFCAAHDQYDESTVLDGELTFADVAEAVGLDGATVDLGDDHLVAWHCTTCDTEESAAGLVALSTFASSRCPTCGEARLPRTTTGVAVPGPHADRTLASFAVRSDEILRVRAGDEERYAWVGGADPDLPESWR